MDKLPPANIEAEQALLGCIMLDPNVLSLIANWLPVEAFFIRAHQKIYSSCLELRKKGEVADLIRLIDWLTEKNEIEEVGGSTVVIRLVNRTVSSTNYDRYAQLIYDKFLRRQLIKLGGDIVEIGYDPDLDISEAYQQILKLLPPDLTQKGKPKKHIKITKLKFSMPTPLHPDSKLEVEAETLDEDNLEQAFEELSSSVLEMLRSRFPTKDKTLQDLSPEES